MDDLTHQISIYQKILSNAVWDKSPLLKVFKGRMEDMVNALKSAAGHDEIPKDAVSVYVLLYHQAGGGLSTWDQVAKNIRYAVKSRPLFFSRAEAVAQISDHSLESVVHLVLPASSLVGYGQGQYLHSDSISKSAVKGLSWQNKLFIFNGVSFIEVG